MMNEAGAPGRARSVWWRRYSVPRMINISLGLAASAAPFHRAWQLLWHRGACRKAPYLSAPIT